MNAAWRVALAGSVLVVPVAACGQSIDRLVAGAGSGTVQFHFASRDGACGNGRDFFRSSDGGGYMNYSNGNGGDDTCTRGPVRAVLVRDGGDIVRIETYVGPLATDPDGGRDLGAVPAAAAATYLLDLAGTLDGRPAREAIVPAMLADSAVVTPQLLRLAKDQARSRDVRNSAIAWAARRRSEPGGAGAAEVQRMLDALIRDRDEGENIRQAALNTVGNLDRGEGVPMLVAFAGDADPWVAREAFGALSRSGDPRARQFVRAAIRRTDLSEDNLTAAIRGLGGEYATAADFKVLRDLYPSVNTDQERSAIISAVASEGGSVNVDWLIALARSPTESSGRRRQVISALARNDDPRVKDALKGLIDR